ncbi:MAG: DegT/DnrJ/EryC1/StrS family aminotransferase [Alphaproteobacteria bacterium]
MSSPPLCMPPSGRRIPVAGPSVSEREIAYVSDAARTAWYDRAGDYVRRFEQAFADCIGVSRAMALPSATSGLHLALAALQIGAGDEVILPDATWIASAAPVTYVGARPVFVDVDPLTWCLDPAAVQAAITPRTKAVIAVDLYGSMPDMDALVAVTARHGIALIEDAAEAFGSTYRGRSAGRLGRVGVFSFHGSKTMTTGEGGMVVSDDGSLMDRMAVLRDHGRPPGDRFFYNGEVAFKYKMSALQAAFGLGQVERAGELVAAKRAIFRSYAERLSGVPGLTLNAEPAGTTNSYWMVTAVLDPALGLDSRALMAALDADGIDSRPFFHPLSSLPAFAHLPDAASGPGRNPVSYRLGAHGINLPSALCLNDDDIDYVTARLRASIAGKAVRAA